MNQQTSARHADWQAAGDPALRPSEETIRLHGHDADPMSGMRDVLKALRRRALPLVAWIVLCLGGAVAYLVTTPSEYLASTQIVLEPRRLVPGGMDQAAAQPLDSAQADSQAQVVRSERNLRLVFDTLDLADDPVFARPAPGLLGRLIGTFALRLPGTPADKPATEDRRAAMAFEAFSDRVAVRRLGQSYVLEVSFRAPSAAQAARLANAVTAAYILDQVNVRAANPQRGTEYLQGRIADIKTEQDMALSAVRTGVIPDAQFPDSDARVVGAALEPLSRAYPQPALVLMVAALFGILSGVATVVLRHKLDRTVRSRQQLGRLVPVDTLHGVPRLPRSRGRSAGPLLTVAMSPDAQAADFAEALRVLRTAVLSAKRSPRNLAIGVASWSAGEGRSTVASNLAFLIAAARERVALVDADLRNPGLSRAFAPDAEAGLAEVLLRAAGMAAVAVPLADSIAFVPAAPRGRAGDPNLFLGSSEMRRLLTELREERDVIVDLPPMALSSDTQAIGPLLDGIVLVVEADRTTVDEVGEALLALKATTAPLLGVVLNKGAAAPGRARGPARVAPR